VDEGRAGPGRVETLLGKAGAKVVKLTPKQLEAFAKRGRETAWPELKKVLGDKVFNEISATFVLK